KKKLKGANIDLAILYCSSKYDYQKAVKAVRQATGKAHLIGCSTSGEFTESKVKTGSIAVGLLSSDDIKFFTAMAEGIRESPESAVQSLVNKLPNKVDGYPNLSAILLMDGLAGVGEEMSVLASKAFKQAFFKNLKIVGGTAGDDLQFKETFVFFDDKVVNNAATICLFASKMPLFTGIKHGHTPLSRPLKITKAKGNVLYEVNGKPAWEVWKKETAKVAKKKGIDVEKLENLPDITKFLMNYELGLATQNKGEYKIRFPSGINNDGSLNFSCGIVEGSIFHIMDGSKLENHIKAVEDAAMTARQAAENSGYTEFAGVLVFECAARLLILGDRFPESVNCLKSVLSGVPILGWETYGEIRLEPGQFSGYHNTTTVVLIIPKCEK
ncbi:FIST C-terminal domain-containing protein, partial [Candidatus Babeliales bacterium]|nr:FIST C-terminal domain-containing protein [Candidatus Babeliales bacterium]